MVMIRGQQSKGEGGGKREGKEEKKRQWGTEMAIIAGNVFAFSFCNWATQPMLPYLAEQFGEVRVEKEGRREKSDLLLFGGERGKCYFDSLPPSFLSFLASPSFSAPTTTTPTITATTTNREMRKLCLVMCKRLDLCFNLLAVL